MKTNSWGKKCQIGISFWKDPEKFINHFHIHISLLYKIYYEIMNQNENNPKMLIRLIV